MDERVRSHENLIRLGLIEEAMGEQTKSQAAEEGLKKGKRGTVATPAQIVGYRRRAEYIYSDMLRNMPRHIKPKNPVQKMTEDGVASKDHQQKPGIKPSSHKRRRGPHNRAAKRNKAKSTEQNNQG
jgi:hypothetical protein